METEPRERLEERVEREFANLVFMRGGYEKHVLWCIEDGRDPSDTAEKQIIRDAIRAERRQEFIERLKRNDLGF